MGMLIPFFLGCKLNTAHRIEKPSNRIPTHMSLKGRQREGVTAGAKVTDGDKKGRPFLTTGLSEQVGLEALFSKENTVVLQLTSPDNLFQTVEPL